MTICIRIAGSTSLVTVVLLGLHWWGNNLMVKNPVAKNLNRNRPQVIPDKRQSMGGHYTYCKWCGAPVDGEVWADYINGHFQCECGRNVDECCSGETNA